MSEFGVYYRQETGRMDQNRTGTAMRTLEKPPECPSYAHSVPITQVKPRVFDHCPATTRAPTRYHYHNHSHYHAHAVPLPFTGRVQGLG
jgi:hypothetical protein